MRNGPSLRQALMGVALVLLVAAGCTPRQGLDETSPMALFDDSDAGGLFPSNPEGPSPEPAEPGGVAPDVEIQDCGESTAGDVPAARIQWIVRATMAYDGGEANGPSDYPALSADGRFVAFVSWADNLVDDDVNGLPDVFRHEFATGQTTRVSVGPLGPVGNMGAGPTIFRPHSPPSTPVAINSDGSVIAFENAVFNPMGHAAKVIFVWDAETGQTSLVSIAMDGGYPDSPCGNPSISGDGRFVAYDSLATDIVAGDTNLASDVFVYDREQGMTTRASLWAGFEGDGHSAHGSISPDGRYVAFDSRTLDFVLEPGSATHQVFVHDLVTGATAAALDDFPDSGNPYANVAPVIARAGRALAFMSLEETPPATRAACPTGSLLHTYQTQFGEELLLGRSISLGAGDYRDGGQLTLLPRAAISGDGLYTAYRFGRTDSQIRMHDFETGAAWRIDVPHRDTDLESHLGGSGSPTISFDGQMVGFASTRSSLVPDDTNGVADDTNGVADIFVVRLLSQPGR